MTEMGETREGDRTRDDDDGRELVETREEHDDTRVDFKTKRTQFSYISTFVLSLHLSLLKG